MRIAMWSGPRNLSTAMMYSFGARDDCAIWDEPFYAAYLAATGLDHPMRAAVIQAGEVSAKIVAGRCVGDIPGGRPVFYQKLMTQHMLPEFDQGWLDKMTNVFLIRHPAKVMQSYARKRESPTLDDIGFVQQEALFNQVADSTGIAPIVVDSDDILAEPAIKIEKLCAAIGLPFQAQMLNWPKGPHKDDGAWALHWYKSVWQSNGFSTKALAEPDITGLDAAILDRAMQSYETLREFRI